MRKGGSHVLGSLVFCPEQRSGAVLMPRDARARQNMYFFREANERTQRLEASWRSEQRIAFVCECSNLGCRAPLYLTVEEFRQVREQPGHFIIVADHIDP